MTLRSSLLRGALAAVALLAAAPAAAQLVQNAASSQVADDLSRYLRAITADPKDVEALIGAGEAALTLGDANAAVAFFARAEEIAPRNGRAKAGLARVMLRLENPRGALELFDDATDLGVPAIDIAGDRGLAYDLRGDTKRAQRDYALALSRGPDDEITRRYALSLGISGDRDKALKLLDPLLYKRDQGAWRARAFVLAMTGDQAGATAIVRKVMPDRLAGPMEGFLARLPGLRAGQKAMAVHLGRFPADKHQLASADAGAGLIPTGAPLGTQGAERARVAEPPPGEVAVASVRRAPPSSPDERTQRPVYEVTVPAPATRAEREATLAAIIANLKVPDQERSPARQVAAAVPAPKAKPAKARAEAKLPARRWVQVAGGANTAALPREWRRLRAKAPAAFKGRAAWTARASATNRLLAGPFDSDGDARAFVNTLREAGIGAFAWTSDAGQEIEKLIIK